MPPPRRSRPPAPSTRPVGPVDPEPVDIRKVHAETRVVKRLHPSQPGALKLSRRYGDALVCVRYRHDPERQHRYTTVELVVDHAPIRHPTVSVQLPDDDAFDCRTLIAHGACWNPETRLWDIPRSAAKKLGLLPTPSSED